MQIVVDSSARIAYKDDVQTIKLSNQIPRAGDQVHGAYYGVPFTGTVTHGRPHTMNAGEIVYQVSLTTPVVVYGMEREAISITVDPFSSRDPERWLAKVEHGAAVALIAAMEGNSR